MFENSHREELVSFVHLPCLGRIIDGINAAAHVEFDVRLGTFGTVLSGGDWNFMTTNHH